MDKPNITDVLMEMALDQKQRIADQVAANFIVDLTPITLMVDKKIITIEEAAQRIEQLRAVSLADQDRPLANEMLQITIDWLRAHDKTEAPGWSPVVHEGGLSQDQKDDQ